MIWLSILYRVGPSRSHAKWRWVTLGSGLAAILLVAASMIFGWYLAKFNSYDKLYGSLGAVVGFMTWLWISVVIMLLGAELDAAIESTSAGRNVGLTPGGGCAPTLSAVLAHPRQDSGRASPSLPGAPPIVATPRERLDPSASRPAPALEPS
jgi:uncharacterized BrkB/YihY/UPF0761 family membrane protein